MVRKVIALFISVVALGVVFACGITYDSRATYFEGSVLVEYRGHSSADSNRYLTITFYEKGDYRISFLSSSEYQKFPTDTQIRIESAPRVRVMKDISPYFSLVIAKDGKTESHKFPVNSR